VPSGHFDEKGRAVMVDVSGKAPTLRTAVASALIRMSPETLKEVIEGRAAKGDVFAVARLAGITAAKKTSDLIPLAHPLAIPSVSIDFTTDPESGTIRVEGNVRAHERTGVEMEAMVAVSIAALTVYDMCKGMDRRIAIGDIVLEYKKGEKSGVFRRRDRS
jgi:cyclic pyranopterin phosphate synthase